MEKDFNDESKSVFNEGMLQIQRLHNSWTRCNHYSSKGLFNNWRWELDIIWRELSYDTFKLNKSKELNDWEDIESVKAMESLDVKIQTVFIKKDNSKIYNLLNRKEVFLRILQHKAGKGSKYESEDERSME